jgi:hypothetical protein
LVWRSRGRWEEFDVDGVWLWHTVPPALQITKHLAGEEGKDGCGGEPH